MWNNGLFNADPNNSSEITGSGTANQVAKFTGAQTIGNSNITDDGTTVTVASRTVIAPPVATSGTPTGLTYTGAAHTTLTAGTEYNDVNYNFARTVQFATGAIATQRAFLIQAPTYGFVGASTITNAATLYVDGAPVAGTNATITNAYSIWVDAGNVRFDGSLSVGTSAAPTAVITVTGSSTARASINVASGTAPTTPNAGDIWYDGTTLNFRGSGFSVSSATNPISFTTGGTASVWVSTNNASGVNNTLFGDSTNVTGGGSYNTIMGRNVNSAGVENILMGVDSTGGTGTGGIAIGSTCTLGNFNYSIAIGYHATTTATQQMVFGGTSGTALSNVFFNAVSNTAANLTTITLQTTGVTAGVADSSAALSILNIAGAKGTGTAAGGVINFQIAMPASASASTQNALVTVATFSGTNGGFTLTQPVNTTGSPTGLTFTGGAHTTLTAGAAAVDVNYNLARTVQFATGAITTQRAFLIQAPTYAFVGASTITTAATLAITAAPTAGTNATITNTYALWVQAGRAQFDGTINGLTLTANAVGFSIAGGTTSKTLTMSNTLTFTGTDASSVAFYKGGTVGYVGRNPQSGTTYTVTDTDFIVGLTNTAARTITLPAANSVTAGRPVWLSDEAGTAGTNNITVNRSGSDTINGATSDVLNSNYQVRGYYSDGVSAWFKI